MASSPLIDQQALQAELGILRQLLLLSCGPSDPFFRRVDAAYQSDCEMKMREAMEAFEHLPASEREHLLGTDRAFDIPCTD